MFDSANLRVTGGALKLLIIPVLAALVEADDVVLQQPLKI
jgi:hypothetical protein